MKQARFIERESLKSSSWVVLRLACIEAPFLRCTAAQRINAEGNDRPALIGGPCHSSTMNPSI